jgi:hypothetical protein
MISALWLLCEIHNEDGSTFNKTARGATCRAHVAALQQPNYSPCSSAAFPGSWLWSHRSGSHGLPSLPSCQPGPQGCCTPPAGHASNTPTHRQVKLLSHQTQLSAEATAATQDECASARGVADCARMAVSRRTCSCCCWSPGCGLSCTCRQSIARPACRLLCQTGAGSRERQYTSTTRSRCWG